MQVIYYKVVCTTYNSVILTTKTFVIFTMFFLKFILMGLSVIWKKIISKSDALIPIVVSAQTAM